MPYVGIMDHDDGSRSYDWSVIDADRYQVVVDARNTLNPVAHAFLVPSAHEEKHQVNWSEITASDIERAGCCSPILYPRKRSPATP